MNKIVSMISVLMMGVCMLCSCADTYSISGSSLQAIYDADTAYLEYTKDSKVVKLNSCEILHGKFTMSGNLDSVMCVILNLGSVQSPVVLEKGDIKVSVQNSALKVEGTPMNDKLYKFLTSCDSLTMQIEELPHREAEMILSGVDHDDILRQLGEEEAELRTSLDKLETEFIVSNFDNTLGVTWFMNLCERAYQRFGFVTTTPQIEDIYSRAPDEFRNNPYVKDYMETANK